MASANSTSILKGANWRGVRWIPALRNWGAYAVAVIVRFKALAPYALIELILPGGSLMALLLWVYRRRKNGVGFGPFAVKLLAFLRFAEPLRSNVPVCAARSVAALGWCANSLHGAFACEKEAGAAGERATRNGRTGEWSDIRRAVDCG